MALFQAANNQHYIPIVDAAIAHKTNDTDFVRDLYSFAQVAPILTLCTVRSIRRRHREVRISVFEGCLDALKMHFIGISGSRTPMAQRTSAKSGLDIL